MTSESWSWSTVPANAAGAASTDDESGDDDERALSFLRAGKREAWLAFRLTTALRVAAIHDLDNVAVGEANEALAYTLDGYLQRRGKISLLLAQENVFLNGRQVRSGQSGHSWLDDFMGLLAKRGVGGALFAGSWSVEAARQLVAAFSARGTTQEERCESTLAACKQIHEPAQITVLTPDEASEFVREEEEAHLSATELAAFYFARLTALASVSHQAIGAGLSPDIYARNVRQTLRKVLEFFRDHTFERRLLALTLHPEEEGLFPLSAHSASVCILSLAMGRLLGLSRGQLSDLGFAALFHDMGRAVGARQAEAGGQREDMEFAHAHVRDGVSYALRGHSYGNSELLRLIVAQEHHRQADGYPDASFLREPHPYSRLVAVADAFHKLQQGTAWAGPLGQAKIITSLREDSKRFDRAAVELLVEVFGRCPRGTILRLTDKATVVTLDGSPRRGHLPIVRRILLPNGSPDAAGQVIPLQAFNQIRAEVDPSGSSVTEWGALQGAGLPGPVVAGVGQGDVLRSAEAAASEEELGDTDAKAVREIVEHVEKAIRFSRLYPRDHPFGIQSLDQAIGALDQYLEWKGALAIRITREGVCLGDELVVPEGGNPTNLSYLLYPDGVRNLRFERGIDREQLQEFVITLARIDEDDEVVSVDLMDALWQREFTHIDHLGYDQLSPGAVERTHDPMLVPVVKALKAVHQPCREVLLRLDAELSPYDGILSGGASPVASADPAQVQAYLTSPAGRDRQAFTAPLDDPFLGDAVGRAADIVAWAASDDGPGDPPHPKDLGRFLVATVGASLWRGDLDRAGDLLSAGATILSDLDRVSRQLTRKHSFDLLVRVLQQQGAGQADQALRYLSFLSDAALPGICKAYGTLVGSEDVRQVLRTFLLSRVESAADVIATLTQHSDAQIMSEGVEILAQAPKGSPASKLLLKMASDRSHKARAQLAAAALDEVTGEGERRECLQTLARGASPGERIQAARRLSEIGDAKTFEALRTLVQGRELLQRDEDEVEAVLATLSALGGLRAVSVLQELSKRRAGLLNKKSTVRISRAATSALASLRDSDVGQVEGRVCGRCRFSNSPGATHCLQCSTDLSAPAPSRTARHKRPSARVAVVPSLDDEVVSAREDATTRFPPGLREQLLAEAHEPVAAPRTNLEHTEEDAANAVLWLCCHPFPPIPIGTKPVIELGRRGTCDLVLDHGSVSRVHAVVRFVGGEAVLEDRSSYGTWVNGERARTAQLKVGDVLTIGPYDVEVLKEDTASPDPEESTRPLRTFASSEAIGGRLERVSLAEVLQQLEFNEKTGTLRVYGEGVDGVLVVYEGKPMFAELGPFRDTAAVLKMITMPRGTFSFAARVEAGEMTMQGQTMTGLLMEASRVEDETSHWKAGE